MKIDDVIRAWKDEEFREQLSGRAQALPAHPAGAPVTLTPEELMQATGGAAAASSWACITVSSWVCGSTVTLSINFCDDVWDWLTEGEPQPTPKGYCFSAETPVQVPGGTLPIHALEAGDRILAFDSAAGRVREARVAGLDVHRVDTPLLTLETGGERLVVTPGHRFHDADGWRAVEVLGGRCLDLREKERPVSLLGVEPALAAHVYNVRVEEHGSYFVGRSGLLVRDH